MWFLMIHLTSDGCQEPSLEAEPLQTEQETEMSIATCSVQPDSSKPEVGISGKELNLHLCFKHANHRCAVLNCILKSWEKTTCKEGGANGRFECSGNIFVCV